MAQVLLTRYGERTLIRTPSGKVIGKVEPLRYMNNRWYGTYSWEAYPEGADEAEATSGRVIPGLLFSKKSYKSIREAAQAAVLALYKVKAPALQEVI